jgi:hypothetical protein
MNQVYCCCGRISRINRCCFWVVWIAARLEVRTRSLTLLLLSNLLLLLLPAAFGVDPRSGSLLLLLRRNRAYFKGPPPPPLRPHPLLQKNPPRVEIDFLPADGISCKRLHFDQIKKGSSVTIPRLV